MDTGRAELRKDIQAYDAQRAELEKNYRGKFVVFHRGLFAGSFDSLENAAQMAVTNFGQGPYLIRQVGAPTEFAMPASVAFRPAHAVR